MTSVIQTCGCAAAGPDWPTKPDATAALTALQHHRSISGADAASRLSTVTNYLPTA